MSGGRREASRGSLRTGTALALAGLLLGALAQGQTPSPRLEQGLALYAKLCSQCHGDRGDGNGIAAPRVLPRPRDFTTGKFKIRQTPNGALPTDADLARIIRLGMPGTSMPAWPQLSAAEVDALVAAVKSFAPRFVAEPAPEPIAIPKPPAWNEASAVAGKEVYARIGCAGCHGQEGRGDGPSAPTLKDDWGNFLRAADLTMPWTFRGGPTREDVYRTFTTGLNGTPMASFADALSEEERWQLVDYIASLSPAETAGYSTLLLVQPTGEELDLGRGEELFAEARAAFFPVVGQLTEPGREFHPSAQGVWVRAVYNRREIAFEVAWHDLRSETDGHNGPDLIVPASEEPTAASAGGEEEAGEESFWGDEEAAPEPSGEEDFWGEEAVAEETAGDDFWGEEEGTPAQLSADREFSDAVAIQLPAALPSGIRKPYFLFGDAQNPVDLWFVDLATQVARRFSGAGSGSLTAIAGEEVSAAATYQAGRWSVRFKRSLRAGSSGVTFGEGQYVPVAFSLWDGRNRERGNKRGLTQWQYLYTLPREAPSKFGPLVRGALAVLFAELLLVAWIRRRYASPSRNATPTGAAAAGSPS